MILDSLAQSAWRPDVHVRRVGATSMALSRRTVCPVWIKPVLLTGPPCWLQA